MSKMHYNTIIIGGGQAGLAAAYHLQQNKLDFCLLEKDDIGDIRRNRYDSLHLFSPRFGNHLPGYRFPGKRNGFPAKDEVADYLTAYAEHFQFPISTHTPVQQVQKKDALFSINTAKGIYTAEHVILATGGFSRPYIPPISQDIDPSVMQLHSSQYKHPGQVDTRGSLVVVGNGNSGVQIADDLLQAGDVYLVYRKKRQWIPTMWLGWRFLQKLGVFKASSTSRLGQYWQSQREPVIGYHRKTFLTRPQMHDAGPIDSIEGTHMACQHKSIENISTIIRATGFQQAWPMLSIPEALDTKGNIIQEKGITPCRGLYTIGLPRQRTKASAMLYGAGADAAYIVQDIIAKHS